MNILLLFHGFREEHIKDSVKNNKLDASFHCISDEKGLYDFVRVEDIYALSDAAGLRREKLVSDRRSCPRHAPSWLKLMG